VSTITVTPTVELSNVPPRVRLDVVDSGTPAIFAATVVRLDPDGRTTEVRTADGNPLPLSTFGATRVGLAYDYEAPFDQPVSYSTLENPATVSAEVTVNETRIWLISPGVPALSMPVSLLAGSLQEEEWAVAQTVHWPMGRALPVVHTDGVRKAAASSLTVEIDTLEDLRGLTALLADTGPLLFNIPPSYGLGVDTCYIAVGAVRNARVTDIGSDPYRAVELPFQVVDRPAGGTQAQRTYADLLVYPTYTALQAAYPTYAALLSGP
jgi:hypothetical protein